jgi:hypothetical protein
MCNYESGAISFPGDPTNKKQSVPRGSILEEILLNFHIPLYCIQVVWL